MKATYLTLVAAACLVLLAGDAIPQGNLNPPGAPGRTMKTLDQIEPRTPISALPYNIREPGSYYLTGDLVGAAGRPGITIDTGDVTLDLNGFALRGVPGSFDGILVTQNNPRWENLTIRNGALLSWGTSGLNAGFSRNGLINEVKAIRNTVHGLQLDDQWIVKDCHTISNGSIGIFASDNNLVSDCLSSFNGSNGVKVASVNIIRSCVVQGNGGSGIRVQFDNQIINNSSDDNERDGIRLTNGDNRVEGNNVTDNDNRGIAATLSGNLIIRNTAAGNDTNYFFTGNNRYGPIVDVKNVNGDISGTTNSDHPWANFEY